MNKKIAVLISFMMVMTFALAACGGGSSADLSDSKYVGTWEATSITAGDVSEDLGGGVYNLTLNGDGTGVFYSKSPEGEEETDEITWVLTDDGFKTKGDTKLKFTDDGDGIKANIMGAELHFTRADEVGPDDGAPDIGTEWGYMGQDPAECAVWKYLATDIASQYDQGDKEGVIAVPVVQIVKTDKDDDGDETDYYGDFHVYNYVVEGDTLKMVSGGTHPGKIEVVKSGDDYTVKEFEQVKDGGNFEPSAKDIFEESYDDFMKVYSDDTAREELRLKGLADYVKTNGLSVTKTQEEGWDPVDIPL